MRVRGVSEERRERRTEAIERRGERREGRVGTVVYGRLKGRNPPTNAYSYSTYTLYDFLNILRRISSNSIFFFENHMAFF